MASMFTIHYLTAINCLRVTVFSIFNYYFVINYRRYIGLLMNVNVHFFNTYMAMNIEMDLDVKCIILFEYYLC